MQIKGRIIQVCEPVTTGNYTKQMFVVETDERYNNRYALSFDPAKISVSKLNEGDNCTVDFNVRSNQSKADMQKWFVELQAWKVSVESNMP